VNPLSPEEAAQHVNLAPPLPTDSDIIVIAFDKADLDDIQGLLLRLSQRGNTLIFPREGVVVEQITRHQPVMVILPDEKAPQWENRSRQRLLEKIKSTFSERVKGGWAVYYEPPLLTSGADWVHFLTPAQLDRKIRAIAAYKTQVSRTDFGAAANGKMLADGIRLAGHHSGDSHPAYAETFSVVSVVDGEIKEGPISWNLAKMRNGTVCYGSPHYDDPEIAAAGALVDLEERGFEIKIIYTSKSTGARMVGPDGKELGEQEKIRVREEETKKGTGILGISSDKLFFLRFGFRKQKITESGVTREVREILEEDRTQFYQALQETLQSHWLKKDANLPLVVFLPDPADNHPAHLATLDIGMEAVLKLSKEVHSTILVVYYKSPWAGAANTYLYLTPEQMDVKENVLQSLSRITAAVGNGVAYATVAPELAAPGGFGQNTINPQQLGGLIAERFDLWQVSQEGELLRVPITQVILGDEDGEGVKDNLVVSL